MRVLFFARDPGGTNNVAPIIKALLATNVEVLVYARDGAFDRFKNYGIVVENIDDTVETINLESIQEFLSNLNLDFIITGTSIADMTERFIWVAAKKIGVCSLAIMDQWMNYMRRFSETDRDNNLILGTEKKYMPDHICVMDEYAKTEMLGEGFAESEIVVTGSPYFEYVATEYEHTKAHCLSQRDYVIGFVSEPTSVDYNNAIEFWGFDEKSIFDDFIDELESKCDLAIKCTVLIRPHPREDSSFYAEFIRSYSGNLDIKLVSTVLSSMEFLKSVDLVCGMSSMLLIEAFMLAKPTVSIMHGLKRSNLLVLDRLGLLNSIYEKHNLLPEICKNLEKKERNNQMYVVKHATKNILNLLEAKHECFGN